ncbi:phosphatase PAP2 family protein [Nocardia vinacea]|uniref:phosphatase PAP2 family protein n=1 Tax=Nocardia vinacea TaxID=96468 RepID=UPI0003132EE9|nr:phosphatase PAP2 family protein [Nocardia vinacea]
MPVIVDLIDRTISEVSTEAATAEIAVSTVVVGIAVIVASLLVDRFTPAQRLAQVTARRAVRAAAVIVMFIELSVQVSRSGWLTGADSTTLDWFTTHRSPVWTVTARAFTHAGDPAGLAVIGLLLAGLLVWRLRCAVPMVLILGTVAVASAASRISKVVVGRTRPPAVVQLMSQTDFSYPSGHVTGTAALAGSVLLAYLGARPAVWRRITAVLLVVVVVAMMAATRLYLGVHWLTDVIGGGLLGCSVVLIGAVLQPYLWAWLHRVPVNESSKVVPMS